MHLSPIPVHSDLEVRGAVHRSHAAQAKWAEIPFEERAAQLKRAARRMLELREDAIDLLRQEVGKDPADVLMSEALGPLDYVTQWIDILRPALKAQKLPINPLAFPKKRGTVEIVPRGVIGVIAPWNFPLAYFFKPVFPALLAGNGVVIKPSEHAPRTAAWFVERLQDILPADLVQCVMGGADAGRALVRSGIDGLVFTGSVKTGLEVLRAASAQLIPCSVELGGKDPAIVLPDCNLERTVAGIVNWAFTNAGQSCSSIERIYVVGDVADRFVSMLAGAASRLSTKPKRDGTVDIPPLVTEAQLATIEAQVQDAIARGAKLLTGGARTGRGLGYLPTVLDRCDHTMRVATEETFGPVVAVIRARNVDEAVRLANDSELGLNASIWSEDIEIAERIARRIEAGVVLVNNHSLTGAMPRAPWTGVKQTGYGIANSTHSLGVFTRPKTYLVDEGKDPDPWWLPIDAKLEEMGHRLAEAQLGRFWEALKVPLLIEQRKRRILRFVRGEKESGLTSIEQRWGRMVVETLYPDGAHPGFAARTAGTDVDEDLETLVQGLPGLTLFGLRVGVLLHGVAAPVLLKKAATFGSLSFEEREEIATRLASSKIFLIRQSSWILKAVGALSKARTSSFRSVPDLGSRVGKAAPPLDPSRSGREV
jgi:acyl-CoA reductase-like NAD-dependent aldehyde dehydrogenase